MKRFLVLAAVYVGCISASMVIWALVTAKDSADDRKDSIKVVIIGAIVLTYIIGNIVDRIFFKKNS